MIQKRHILLIVQPKRNIEPREQLHIVQIKQAVRRPRRAASPHSRRRLLRPSRLTEERPRREIRVVPAVRCRGERLVGGEGCVVCGRGEGARSGGGDVGFGCRGGGGVGVLGLRRRRRRGAEGRGARGVVGAVDFGGAGEGGEGVGWRGGGVGVAVCWEAGGGGWGVCSVVGFVGGEGGFAGAAGGLVKVAAEVADGGCAGVGPDAAAGGDVFEDVDGLVGEPGGWLVRVVLMGGWDGVGCTCWHSAWVARLPWPRR